MSQIDTYLKENKKHANLVQNPYTILPAFPQLTVAVYNTRFIHEQFCTFTSTYKPRVITPAALHKRCNHNRYHANFPHSGHSNYMNMKQVFKVRHRAFSDSDFGGDATRVLQRYRPLAMSTIVQNPVFAADATYICIKMGSEGCFSIQKP